MKKFLLMLFISAIVFSLLNASVFAAQKLTGIKSSTEEQENELLKNADQHKIYQLQIKPFTTEVPLDGDTQVAPYTFNGSGAIHQDSKNGSWDAIKDYSLFLGGMFDFPYIGVAQLVNDVATLLGYSMPSSMSTEYTTAETLVMYTYFGKDGQVYNSATNKWITYWDTRSRNTYQVKNAYWYDANHQPHSGSKTSTYPDKVQYSAHYFDDTYIRQQAWNNWHYGLYWTVETGY
jgi:hypothetical protein